MQPVPEESNLEKLHIKEGEVFENLKVVVGRDNHEKIEKMKTFIIGAGAIGC